MKLNFDYTGVPVQLIYHYRTNLDDFGVEEPLTLSNCIYEILYKDLSGLWMFEDIANKIFNITYYICTVALIDRHPDRRFGKFMKTAYDSMNASVDEGPILAFVLLQIHTHNWDSSPAIKRIAESIEKELQLKHKKSYKQIYLDVKNFWEKNTEIITLPPESDFMPRNINRPLLKSIKEDWCKLLGTDEEKIIPFITAIGKNEEERNILIDFLQDELSPLFDSDFEQNHFFLELKVKLYNYPQPTNVNNEPIQTTQTSKLEQENAELRAKLSHLQEYILDDPKAKGLTLTRATFFIYAFAKFCGKVRNKKTQLAPIINNFFGYSINSAQRIICEAEWNDSREYFSKMFREICPDFADYVEYFENNQHK